jgi:hypothetical protein
LHSTAIKRFRKKIYFKILVSYSLSKSNMRTFAPLALVLLMTFVHQLAGCRAPPAGMCGILYDHHDCGGENVNIYPGEVVDYFKMNDR